MTVLVTLKFPVQPAKLEDFLIVLKEALKETRAYNGCKTVQTFLEKGTSAVFLVETWESAEHQQNYMGWRIETGLIDALDPYLDGEIDVHTFDPLATV